MKLYDPTENVPVFDKIEKSRREEFLKVLLTQYVQRYGLGGMSKADFDALIVHYFLKCSKEPYNSFELSNILKIKESRIRSLVETAAVKFETDTEQVIWMDIVKNWASAVTEIESIERGQVVFKFENPARFRYIQKEVRLAGGTVTYSRSSEAITISLGTLFKVLDQVYRRVFEDKKGHQYLIENVLKRIKTDLIGTNELKKIQDDKERKHRLTKILSNAANLASIGQLIAAVYGIPLPK